VAISLISLHLNAWSIVALAFIWARYLLWYSEALYTRFHAWRIARNYELSLSFLISAWYECLYLSMSLLIIAALVIVYSIPPAEKNIIREGWAAPFAMPNFLKAFGIPMNIGNSSRRIRTAIFCCLGNLVSFYPIALLLFSPGIIYMLFVEAILPYQSGSYSSGEYPMISVLLANLIWVAFSIVACSSMVFSFRIVGDRGLRASRRFLRVSLQQAQASDPRRPVLFLRSFRDDSVVLPAPKSNFAYRLFTYAERNKSLDELLLEEGSSVGPVVALGSPADPVPPYGAARGYFQDSDWQKMMAGLMADAIAVVICVDNTESLWWEIEYVSTNGYIDKTLLLLHPKYDPKSRTPDIRKKIIDALKPASISDPGALADSKMIGVWIDGKSRVHVGLASTFSRVHYLLILRWFLRSKVNY
jgi:hypothetical protein